jgi:hypothetical protein
LAIKSDQELVKAAEDEIMRIRLEAEENIEMYDDALQMLQSQAEIKDRLPPLPSDPSRHVRFPVPMPPEYAASFDEQVAFERALALDQGKSPPKMKEIAARAAGLGTKMDMLCLKMLLDGHGAKEIVEAFFDLAWDNRWQELDLPAETTEEFRKTAKSYSSTLRLDALEEELAATRKLLEPHREELLSLAEKVLGMKAKGEGKSAPFR